MCGIAGLWLKQRADGARLDGAVAHFRQSLNHRGPDAFGLHRTERAVFVNLRLAIVDRAATGNQPFYSPDGQSGIVYNGEVYNWQALRAPLEGHFPFKSHTDTEVLLASYLAQGDEAFARFNGMFGLCIWNDAQESVVLARDRFGSKPLYVYEDEHCIAFASELKGLLGLPGLDLTPDPVGVQDYLAFRYNLAPFTLFKRIKKLPAGHFVRYVKGERTALQAFASLAVSEPEQTRPEHDYVEELDALLSASVKSQLMGEVPIGVLLSGGLDSSSIAAYVHKAGARLKAYSIGLPEVNEFEFSRDVAQRFELDYVELCISQDELRQGTDRVLRELDEPIADPACFALSRICQRIKEDVTVVLSGEGGDELFAGYNRHQIALAPGLSRDHCFLEFFQRCSNNIDANDWMREKGTALHHLRYRPHFDQSDSLLSGMQNFELNTWLPENLMMKADKIAMAHSLEGRFPFLDVPLFEFASRLPRALKIPQPGASKHVLRQLMGPQLPPSVLTRPKMGFTVPPAYILAPLRERLLGAVEHLRQQPLGQILDLKAVQTTIERYYADNASMPVFRIWGLAVLLLWWAEVLPSYLPKAVAPSLPPEPIRGEDKPVVHHVLCDGGLSNRFNALIFALVLRRKFGGHWRISWPVNNWCGARFHELFQCDIPVDERNIDDYKASQAEHLLLMHENQVNFAPEHLLINRHFTGYADYEKHLSSGRSCVYYNSLIPNFASFEELRDALQDLQPNADVARRALTFCQQHGIDRQVQGLHIRKTDFGDRVNDEALFQQVQASAARFFVCSDDAQVNQRFAALPQCVVFEKTTFPLKMVDGAGWNQWTQDASGRQFPFNITRPATAVVEGLIDQLILSKTAIVSTSNSTFLHTAKFFGEAQFLKGTLPAGSASAAAPLSVTPQHLYALLDLIRPWQMNSDHKVRIGAAHDGGYVLPSSSLRSSTLLSIGMGGGLAFDEQLAQQGAQVLRFDPTPEIKPGPKLRFEHHRRAWASDDASAHASLKTMVNMLDWSRAQHAILKFESGGAEWAGLRDADPTDLARFEVLVGKFHQFERLTDRTFFDSVFHVFTKLHQTHRVIHLHASNAEGMVMLGGVPFPRVLELTWMRVTAASFYGHSNEPIPGPLDRPNLPQLPDLHLRAF